MRTTQRLDAAATLLGLCVLAAQDAMSAPAQADILATYHLSVVQYGWASTLSFLSIAIATPIISRFGDVFDKRIVLAVSMALVCCGELACMMANSLAMFVFGQILLGSFVGVTTVAMARMSELLPPERQASGQGLIQGATGFFATAGTLCAGVIIAAFGTRSMFWLPLLFVLPCSLFLGRTLLGGNAGEVRTERASTNALDLGGGILLACVLTLFCMGMMYLFEGGLFTKLSIGALCLLCVVALPWWLRIERRHPAPIVDVRLFGNWGVASIHLLALLLGIATTMIFVLFPMLVTSASAAGASYEANASLMGILLVPTGLVGVALMPVYGVLDRRLRPGTVLALGFVFIALALMMPIFFRHAIWQLLACTTMFGIGLNIVFTEGITELIRLVPDDRASSASGTFFLAKTIGAILGTQIGTIILGSSGEEASIADLGQLDLAFGLAALSSLIAILIALSMRLRSLPVQASLER